MSKRFVVLNWYGDDNIDLSPKNKEYIVLRTNDLLKAIFKRKNMLNTGSKCVILDHGRQIAYVYGSKIIYVDDINLKIDEKSS